MGELSEEQRAELLDVLADHVDDSADQILEAIAPLIARWLEP